MAFADLRPETIGNHDGTDGLRLRDLPELRIQSGKATFEKIPTIVTVRPTLSKTRCKYFTFLGEEGCTYLREYLEERIRNGETPSPETPLIGYERSKRSGDEFLSTRKITHYVRAAMRDAGVRKRPYVLRAYAETQLIIAESKGKISHPYLQFIAGHKGDVEARYSTNKGRLPPDMIEDMQSQYKACEPFLNTTSNLEESAVVKEAQIEALKSIAKNLLGIDLLEVKVAKERAWQGAYDDRRAQRLRKRNQETESQSSEAQTGPAIWKISEQACQRKRAGEISEQRMGNGADCKQQDLD
jgi:hypothetical protein